MRECRERDGRSWRADRGAPASVDCIAKASSTPAGLRPGGHLRGRPRARVRSRAHTSDCHPRPGGCFSRLGVCGLLRRVSSSASIVEFPSWIERERSRDRHRGIDGEAHPKARPSAPVAARRSRRWLHHATVTVRTGALVPMPDRTTARRRSRSTPARRQQADAAPSAQHAAEPASRGGPRDSSSANTAVPNARASASGSISSSTSGAGPTDRSASNDSASARAARSRVRGRAASAFNRQPTTR